MQRATRVMPDGKTAPFFLTREAHTGLTDFVHEQPASDCPQVLVLAGPVKSGKTTVLHSVLPSLIHDAHRAGKTPRPLIVRFTFDLRAPPADAAFALLEAVNRTASAVGLPFTVEYHPGWAQRNVDWALGQFAQSVKGQLGGQLWLLLDESQVSAARTGSHVSRRPEWRRGPHNALPSPHPCRHR